MHLVNIKAMAISHQPLRVGRKSNKLFSVQFFEVYLQALFTNISQINIISGLFVFVGSDPVTLLLGRRVSEH